MNNTMNKDEAIALMESSTSEAEWNANCNTVKRAFGGYPDWWFDAVVVSGLTARVSAKFGGDDRIRVTVYET